MIKKRKTLILANNPKQHEQTKLQQKTGLFYSNQDFFFTSPIVAITEKQNFN